MLVLIRHAKSDWKHRGAQDGEDSSDFRRPLSERGKSDAVLMARHIQEHAPLPDCFLSSSADRAMETSHALLQEMAAPSVPSLVPQAADGLYLASHAGIMSVIRDLGEGTTLYVCGHNPGISDFARRMSGVRMGELPTLGVVIFHSTPGLEWAGLDENSLKIKTFLAPRQFK